MTRKMTAILLVMALLVAMAVPASAATADSASVASLNTTEWYKMYMGNEYNIFFQLIPVGKARIINYDAAPDVTVSVLLESIDEAEYHYYDNDSGSMQAQVTREGAQCFLVYGKATYKVNGYTIHTHEENDGSA